MARKQKYKDGMICEVLISEIRRDPALQSRAGKGTDLDVVHEYYAVYRDTPEKMPPVEAVWDGEDLWLCDGFQRCKAAEKAGRPTILVQVFLGSHFDAKLRAAGANAVHGVRRSSADIRKQIRMVLDDPRSTSLSTIDVARICRVNVKTVQDEREIDPGPLGPDDPYRTTTKGQIIVVPPLDRPRHSPHIPLPHSEADLKKMYSRRVFDAISRIDPSAEASVKVRFGTIPIVTATHHYWFAMPRDPDKFLSFVIRPLLIRQDCNPAAGLVIVGFFRDKLEPYFKVLREGFRVEFKSPGDFAPSHAKEA